MKKLIVLILASFVVLSCTTLMPSKPATPISLDNTKWILADKVSGNTPILNIEVGRISGNSGCNSYSGNATINSTDGTFIAGNLASTKKACQDMSHETTFLSMLSKANRYQVSDNELNLYQDQILLLKFTQQQ